LVYAQNGILYPEKMKPGTVIKVSPSDHWRNYSEVMIIDSLLTLKQGNFPLKKRIPKDETGFIVSLPDDKETMFDWLVEASFPNFNLQGWIPKNDIIVINP